MSLSRPFFFLGVVLLAGCGSEVTQSINVDGEPSTWVRRTGRSSDGEPVGLTALVDGGVVMAGRYYGEIDFGGGKLPSPNENYQAFVVKYDKKGQHVYSKSFGDEFAEAATDVAALPDGSVLVTGTFNWPVDFGRGVLSPLGTDIFVLKLDSDGNTVWSQRFGGDGPQRPRAIAATGDGGAVIVGATSGKFDVGLGDAVDTSSDAFVLRLDSMGAAQWFDIMDSDGNVNVNDVAVGFTDGLIALGGSFYTQVSVGELPDLLTNGDQDGFLAAYDDTGKAQWRRSLGGLDYGDTVNAVAFSPDESTIYATGQVIGPVDLGGGVFNTPEMYDPNTYLLAVSKSGAYSKSRLYGGHNSDTAYGLATDAEGNVYLAGEYFGNISFGAVSLASKGNSDAYVGKVRPGLEPAFQQGWGDTEQQTTYRVAVDGNGRVYVAGAVLGTVDFGLGPTSGSGYYETFLVALPR